MANFIVIIVNQKVSFPFMRKYKGRKFNYFGEGSKAQL